MRFDPNGRHLSWNTGRHDRATFKAPSRVGVGESVLWMYLLSLTIAEGSGPKLRISTVLNQIYPLKQIRSRRDRNSHPEIRGPQARKGLTNQLATPSHTGHLDGGSHPGKRGK